jgi:hypothetical protein
MHALGACKHYATQHVSAACISRRLGDDERPPALDPQVCSKCHGPLPAGWCKPIPHKRSGHDNACLACRARYHRERQRVKLQIPQQKQCRRSQRVLDACCFHRDNANVDGLDGICRECQSDYFRGFKQPLTEVDVPAKLCCQCNVAKPCFCILQRAAECGWSRVPVHGLRASPQVMTAAAAAAACESTAAVSSKHQLHRRWVQSDMVQLSASQPCSGGKARACARRMARTSGCGTPTRWAV